jgi:hypothetical protein
MGALRRPTSTPIPRGRRKAGVSTMRRSENVNALDAVRLRTQWIFRKSAIDSAVHSTIASSRAGWQPTQMAAATILSGFRSDPAIRCRRAAESGLQREVAAEQDAVRHAPAHQALRQRTCAARAQREREAEPHRVRARQRAGKG